MHIPKQLSEASSGSLTPQLEGAPHTTAHIDRISQPASQKAAFKGGDRNS